MSQIALTEQEIERLQATVDHLSTNLTNLVEPEAKQVLTERALYLRKLNELQPCISILPVETLSTIFQFVCSPLSHFSEHGFQEFSWHHPFDTDLSIASVLVLSAVSHRWRQVAISLPQLWQILRVLPRPTQYHPESWVNLLRLCIDRSSSSMDLLLDYQAISHQQEALLPHPEDSYLTLDELEWAVYINSPRTIKSLSLIGCSGMIWWLDLVKLLAQLTNLERLRLNWSGGGETEIEIGIPRFLVVGSRLTIVDLKHFPYGLALELMRHCPNLIHYRCYQPSTPDHPEDGTQNHQYNDRNIFPCLEWLDWPAEFVPETLLFGSISTPALRGLKWRHILPHATDEHLISRIDATFLQFVSTTGNTLTELDLVPGTAGSDSSVRVQDLLTQSFNQLPNLRKLTLRGSRFQLSFLSSSLITPLMKHSSTIPSPSLQFLAFHLFSPPSCVGRRPKLTVATHVLDLLEQRWELGLVRHFQLALNFPYEWEDEVRDGFQKLVEQGLQLELLVETKPVDWLAKVPGL
ncbi:hypothetical protein D9756_002361 [Leucocoprinus leucothites]|uniref:F-box domain-containing protein n=1 Tax=Leucocoprinus leucothites TaxID=201217 RepID=A0A8H5GBP2_9AGAR|nr:hypothetical protein D9756_002361 [Leucoagaricus leucothites]